ncbi:MAG: replication-associated recombination protein A [Proteobacteria bacterium]|nr:replication-associated recombination protein A [Pseudomonadota bacterium]
MTTSNYSQANELQPLAARMRPRNFDDFFGHAHLLGKGKPLRIAIESNHPHSMILWGPPGSGKTTLASMISHHSNAHMEKLSAVLSGVKEIREAIASAKEAQKKNQRTILFIDEVHRFNKAQQDAFLPHVEDGTVTFIGATTENPSFELNNALLSRARVYVLKRLEENDLLQVISAALHDEDRGLGKLKLNIPQDLQKMIAHAADGDARRTLTFLEIISELAITQDDQTTVTESIVKEVLSGGTRLFDKGGEAFYDQISALHKSIRGTDPDAALYWFMRMIDGGCDPLYIARRLVRAASEDIGNADPRALQITMNAWDVQERLGSPEGELALAQAVVYLACAPKSNAVYKAFNAVMRDVQQYGSLEVPLHLRNAPTKLMKALDYGKEYRYPHDEPGGYAKNVKYFPDEMPENVYYRPVTRGLEIQIKEKLETLKK